MQKKLVTCCPHFVQWWNSTEVPSSVQLSSERASGSQSPHSKSSTFLFKFKTSKLFSLLGLAFLALRIRLLFWMFLHVRIKTKGGERETHKKNNALKSLNCLKHFHLPVKTSCRCLCGIYFLSPDFKVASGRDWRLQCPPHPLLEVTKSIFT